jgi:DNA-binding transcriptional LysR family regulator
VNPRPILDADLDMRSLRAFVAVAEELHFTRAATRLFIAQQALSREIRRLERQLGAPLFVRTTRRVTLTPEGERLLPRARGLIALHDQVVTEMGSPARPVLVDLISAGPLTGSRILEAARAAATDFEFRRRHGGGIGTTIRLLQAAELDVGFGRADWVGQRPTPALDRRLVRFEPLAALLPGDHPLAAKRAVRLRDLAGTELDTNPGSPDAHEWIDLMAQFVELAGARPTPPHLPALGLEDQALHLVQQGLPIITTVDHVPVPGGVIRPIVDPVPIYAWSMLWRRGDRSPGVAVLAEAADTVGRQRGWLTLPAEAWLPEPEASRGFDSATVDKRAARPGSCRSAKAPR